MVVPDAAAFVDEVVVLFHQGFVNALVEFRKRDVPGGFFDVFQDFVGAFEQGQRIDGIVQDFFEQGVMAEIQLCQGLEALLQGFGIVLAAFGFEDAFCHAFEDAGRGGGDGQGRDTAGCGFGIEPSIEAFAFLMEVFGGQSGKADDSLSLVQDFIYLVFNLLAIALNLSDDVLEIFGMDGFQALQGFKAAFIKQKLDGVLDYFVEL